MLDVPSTSKPFLSFSENLSRTIFPNVTNTYPSSSSSSVTLLAYNPSEDPTAIYRHGFINLILMNMSGYENV